MFWSSPYVTLPVKVIARFEKQNNFGQISCVNRRKKSLLCREKLQKQKTELDHLQKVLDAKEDLEKNQIGTVAANLVVCALFHSTANSCCV